ncbi:MAG: hypothetical protein VYE22_26065 [Myxococcota bacterium]|nr:hypothetical protein [Myxococcota bacterium]
MDRRDLSEYLRPPRLSSLSGVFVSRALLEVTPPDPSDALRRAAGYVRETGEAIRLVLMERSQAQPPNIRASDLRADTIAHAIRDGLQVATQLTPTELARRAAVLLTTLFPDGTGFLRLPAREQWGQTEVLLQRIDRDGLASEIDAVLRPEYLALLREAHEAYGRALGLGHDANDAPKSDALRDSITDLSYAIAEYGRVLVGELVPGDEASEARFRRAVGPLDAHREALARRARAGGEEPEEPEVDIDSPLPEVDPPTPPVVDDPPPVPADA